MIRNIFNILVIVKELEYNAVYLRELFLTAKLSKKAQRAQSNFV